MGLLHLIFGKKLLETNHRCYQAQPSPVPPDTQLEILPSSPIGENESSNIYVHSNSSNSIGSIIVANNIWTLYFDASKMQDGFGASCVLIDPCNKKRILSCHLEFECINNNIEYEVLVLVLKKAIDLKVEFLKV